MKVMIIGSGGREHAIAESVARSKRVSKVIVTPGNAGMAKVAEIFKTSNFQEIYNHVLDHQIDFVIIGPEQPLQEGLADYLGSKKVAVIGPNQLAARLETSKVFAKKIMQRNNIPTADYREFSDYNKAVSYLSEVKFPTVIKADGLAAGKGVVIADDKEIAVSTLKKIMLDRAFGEAGQKIIIEEFLTGYEGSVFAFTDGKDYKMTIVSHDYKKAYDGDKGPNTGGMGAFAPVKVSDTVLDEIGRKVFAPLLEGLNRENIVYKGVLYAGLIFTGTTVTGTGHKNTLISNPDFKVLEFNCRLGDPETQAVLPLLETDFIDICEAITHNKIAQLELNWKKLAAVNIVAASEGYPGRYEKGRSVDIDNTIYQDDSLKLFFANVIQKQDMRLYTSGGRVLSLTALAPSISEAADKAYANIEKINFDNKYYRKDIALQH